MAPPAFFKIQARRKILKSASFIIYLLFAADPKEPIFLFSLLDDIR